jgi:hypothetical protein
LGFQYPVFGWRQDPEFVHDFRKADRLEDFSGGLDFFTNTNIIERLSLLKRRT